MAGLAAVGVFGVGRSAHAGDSLPVGMQAKLLSKVAKYDRNFAERAGERAQIRVAQRRGNGESEASAGRLVRSIDEVGVIAGLPLEVAILDYAGPGELASQVTDGKLAVVVFSPGFRDQLVLIAGALAGKSILTVAADADEVAIGAALGFALEEGKSKIIVNNAVAKAQQVDFSSSLLKIARVL